MKKTQVAFITFIMSFIVLGLKLKAYYATHSLGVMSDALETVVNVLTAVFALAAVKIAAEPADANHPYGHGKLEYFSAAFEGGLIFFAGVAILFQSAQAFIKTPAEIHAFGGNIYLFAATALNLIGGLFLKNYGQKNNSEALEASGRHLMSDVLTTAGVFSGLVLVKLTGLNWIDIVVAVAVGFYLLYEAYDILQNTIGALMDAADEESLTQLCEILNRPRAAEIIDIHQTRIIRAGHFHHIDAHVVVPEYLNVAAVHQLTDEFEKSTVAQYKFNAEIAFHIDPCKRSFCGQCRIENCPVRRSEFTEIKKFTIHDLTKGPSYSDGNK